MFRGSGLYWFMYKVSKVSFFSSNLNTITKLAPKYSVSRDRHWNALWSCCTCCTQTWNFKGFPPFFFPLFICIVQILNKKKKKQTTKANSDIPATWFTTELLISINQFSRINESYAHAWLPGSRKWLTKSVCFLSSAAILMSLITQLDSKVHNCFADSFKQ